jgi:hypothetical protein
MSTDRRTIVGALVSAKACNVTSMAECARRYGANAKTKLVVGVVLSSSSHLSEGGRHASTFITASDTSGGGEVRTKTLGNRSVHLLGWHWRQRRHAHCRTPSQSRPSHGDS